MATAQETNQDRPATRPTSVFEWMERVKMPALWICVVIMGGFGVLTLFGDLFQRSSITVEEIGAFKIPGGEKVAFTNVDWAEEAQRVIPQLHRMTGGQGRTDYPQLGSAMLRATVRDEDELAWTWFILREAASAAGITVTDDVIVAASNKSGAGDLTLREYQRKVAGDFRAMRRDLIAINQFRDAMDRAQPEATWDKLYERFKSSYEEMRASFVLFDTAKAEVPLDPKNNPEDRTTLEKWLADNPAIRSQKRIPEELDARILYARFKDATTEDLKRHYEERWAPLVAEHKLEVSDEKLRQRFDIFRSAWDVPLREASNAFEKSLESRPDSRSVDRPTEFEMVKDRLRIESLATMLVEKAHGEVTRAESPLGFEDAAQRYGLRLATVSHLDSRGIQQHVDFGSPRVANPLLQGLREKTLKPGDVYAYQGDASLAKGPVEEPGSNVAIWQVVGYHPEREATLDDAGMLDYFTEEYRKKRRQDLAKEEAEAFRKAVEERVTSAVDTRRQELEAEMTVALERRLAEAQLDRKNPEHQPRVLEIENDERQKKDAKLDDERAKVEPSIYLAVAAERFLTVRNTGWMAKTTNRNANFQQADDLTTSEKAERFFRKSARRLALAGVKPGRMGPVEAEPAWAAAAVPLLLEKRAPAPEDLYKLSRSQLDQLEQQVSPRTQTLQFWSYENFKRPEWFDLNVPGIERGLEEKLKADQKRAEQQRLREEQKRKQAKALAEKAAQDALQVRPLFSGEDW
jgi:hypothetical protein